ncbi:serine/threonine protein kinase [Virgibacillus indicus]|uniref:Serine/threonine-protein kinase PrkC n=1 Tax=Virgibacillus indicus TaxID=2024554 RepID=A0A265NGH6_9BACI|nr:Stk1 family PASTA domain-containing Ser/Thr kinase [Virgibacillus indicus]OZU90366.1 serine/threonine protein kinase [Virgibacillus indicus]
MLNGHLLNERYKIEKTIGGGGMANVYLARDIILDRDVAIKVLRLEYANDEEFIARFDREAHSASSLSHPNIVNIYDVGEEDNILYMVMEYVDGMTLKEYIQRYSPLDVEEALDIMRQITSAITHAHDNDIVHRDIKPQNILIDTYGQVKVTDFGIAIALSATSLTQTNSILGSVHYLSPEQARGGMATKKSDIYSIGIVLFELLTGRLPFSGQSPVSIALKHLQNDTPSVRRYNQGVPQSVENIVLQATAKDPFHRYETVYDLNDALESALLPSKQNEEVFSPPMEAGDETKAIPVITDNQLHPNENQDTIIHQTNSNTKTFTGQEEKASKASKKKKTKKQKKPKKAKKGKKKWITLLIILFLLLLSGVAAMFILPDLLKPKDVEIPDVTEMDYDEAKEELENHNLVAEREFMYSDEIEEGKVVRTDPRAGSTRKEESTVTVFVSQGKEKEVFDDYVGRDYEQVERILGESGYSEIIPIEKHSDRPSGEITRQIQPSPDAEVVPSDTKVIFEISIGPELISLNNLKGMSEQEARDYLEGNNLTMNVIEDNSDSVPKGEVISQEPSSGTNLEEGDSVNVYISTGPEAKPPRTHSATFIVPYEPENQGDEGDQETNPEPVEQTVRIYIKDMDNPDISEVYQEDIITEDKNYKINLTIAPGKEAEYRVMRDDDVIIEETVPYEEGD